MTSHDGAAGRGDGRGSASSLMGRICQACVHSIPVTGAAVSVMTAGGHRGLVYATDDTARSLEDVQFTVGDGPGCAAFESGRAVLVPDLAASAAVPEQQGWPGFRDLSRELEVRAVFSFPLHLGRAVLGALTTYRLAQGTPDGPSLARALRLSDAAAAAALDLIVGADTEQANPAHTDSPSDEAQLYRAEIYQAAGMVTVQFGVGIDVATLRVRAHAFATGEPISDIARQIVHHQLHLEADDAATTE